MSAYCYNAMFMQEGRTPLHFAAVEGFKDVCEVLVDHGADMRAITEVSSTIYTRNIQYHITSAWSPIADRRYQIEDDITAAVTIVYTIIL
jgi:ankyrin repeat protein